MKKLNAKKHEMSADSEYAVILDEDTCIQGLPLSGDVPIIYLGGDQLAFYKDHEWIVSTVEECFEEIDVFDVMDRTYNDNPGYGSLLFRMLMVKTSHKDDVLTFISQIAKSSIATSFNFGGHERFSAQSLLKVGFAFKNNLDTLPVNSLNREQISTLIQ